MTATSGSWGEQVESWERTTSCCGECGTVYGGHACPCCGEWADASPVGVVGYVSTDRDEQDWLTIVATNGADTEVSRRAVSSEQVAWLRRGMG